MALTISSVIKLSSGHNLPALGFGVYQNAKCADAVKVALQAGYRHIDSAQMYRNEEECGRAFRESGLKREDVFITSKCASRSHGYESTLKGIDTSLEKFGLDYIDLFLIHDPLSGQRKRLETWRALLDAKKAGKIRTAGVSNYGVKHFEEIKAAGLETPAVNQVELHPLCQQRPIVEYCQKNSIAIEAYTPLIRGAFDIPTLQSITQKHKKEPAQVLIRWSLQKGYSPLPKSATPSRIISNAEVFDFELDREDMEALDALDKGDSGAVTWNPIHAD